MGPGATRESAAAAVNAVLDAVGKAAQTTKARLPGFGSFETVARSKGARLVFRPSSKLLQALKCGKPFGA